VFRTSVARPVPQAAGPNLVRLIMAVRTLVLGGVLLTVPFAEPRLGAGARGVAIAIALAVSTICWGATLLAERSGHGTAIALALTGVAGGALAGLSPLSTAVAVGCVVTSAAAVRLTAEASVAITAGTVAAFLITGISTGDPVESLIGYSLGFVGLWAFGLTRHAYVLRAQSAEQTLAETRRAREAETQAAALAERARIAREIHDVLAHSLAAVSVNLQAAEGLLGSLPPGSPELARALECIGRAGAFTREGLADARRAIQALRDDVAPLPDQLSVLAAGWQADGDTPVTFTVSGRPRPVAAEVGLAAFRTAQEALTNARKHAPGQPVGLTIEFCDHEIAVQVVNPMPESAGPAPASATLAAPGPGFGLTGLRERAALGGGQLDAGPAGGNWRVCLRIPA
jgi:signal transduction histidine kinase